MDNGVIPAGFCQCGCGEPTNRVGTADRQREMAKEGWKRYRRGHNNRLESQQTVIIEGGIATLLVIRRDGSRHKVTVDAVDSNVLKEYRWVVRPSGYTFYVSCFIDGRHTYIHRLILNPPAGKTIDHINHDGLDNRRGNIRVCDQSQNVRNSRLQKRNKSGYRGVFRDKNLGKWVARIGYHGKYKRLGVFTDIQDAARAYDVAALSFGDKHISLNFPGES